MSRVTVDDDFARFGGKSYAINKINSVEVRERQPHSIVSALICAVLTVGCVAGTLGSLSPQRSDATNSLGLAVVFGGLTFWLWRRSLVREYQLFLMTSSSETQAFTTNDEGEVEELRQRIEAAMTRHSRVGFNS